MAEVKWEPRDAYTEIMAWRAQFQAKHRRKPRPKEFEKWLIGVDVAQQLRTQLFPAFKVESQAEPPIVSPIRPVKQ